MRGTAKKSLTQDELVAELHGRGYADVTARRLADWRARDLLPHFDVVGGGQGRGRGRGRSSWSDGDLVINQAVWVYELAQIYGSLDDLLLPLWMLGYHVPRERVRRDLLEPLEALAQMIESEAGSTGELEDLIDDAVYEAVREWSRAGAKLFEVPQPSMEAFFNILANPGYDLTDSPFEEGVKAMRDYERARTEEHRATLASKGLGPETSEGRRSSAGEFFDGAPVIKEYFSLYPLKEAVEQSTAEDLLAVESDVDVLREMLLMMHRMWKIAARDLGPEFSASPERTLPPIFFCGRLIVLADLSLRRRGYSEHIDTYLPVALTWLREKCDEKLERELAEASKSVALAVNTAMEVVIESLQQEGEAEEHSEVWARNY